MASTPDFVQYVCDQLAGAGAVTSRKMFGEYAVYCNGKLPILICDNIVYLKITAAGAAMLESPAEAPPYPGAKPCFVIENLEDGAFLAELVRRSCEELPEPKPKKKK